MLETTSLITAVNTAANVTKAVNTAVNVTKNVIDKSKFVSDGSLMDITKIARVEPLCCVSNDLMKQEYTSDILNVLVNIITGYYMQAVALSSQVDNISVAKMLDRLNPDRDLNTFISTLSTESMTDIKQLVPENYKFKLPLNNDEFTLHGAMEDSNGYNTKDGSNKLINDSSNLVAGKVIDVELTINQTKLKIPVTVRLSSIPLTGRVLANVLVGETEDTSITERFHSWRSGRISFMSDFILCQDLIDNRKKALMKDTTGVYSELVRRSNNGKKYGLLSQKPSLATASNIYVITESDEEVIKKEMGGSLSKKRVRDKVFKNTYAMIIAVVDRERERVVIYYRGVSQSSDMHLRDVKKSGKEKGPDTMDIFKNLIDGKAPQLI